MNTPLDKIIWPDNVYHSSAYWSMDFREWLAEEIANAYKIPTDTIAGNVICNYEFTVKFRTPEADPAKPTATPTAHNPVSFGVFDLVQAWCDAVRPPQEKLMGYLSDFQTGEPGSIEWVRGLFAMRRVEGTIPV